MNDSEKPNRRWEGAVRTSLDAWDVIRGEGVRGWKILLRLLKGSQLTQERRKILEQLGAIAADRLRDKQWTDPEQAPLLESLVDQLDRLDRKVRLEERLIAQLKARGSGKGTA